VTRDDWVPTPPRLLEHLRASLSVTSEVPGGDSGRAEDGPLRTAKGGAVPPVPGTFGARR
jgi:hypothetical protein